MISCDPDDRFKNVTQIPKLPFNPKLPFPKKQALLIRFGNLCLDRVPKKLIRT